MSKAAWIAENLKDGEKYAGIILGKNGDADHHLILLAGQAEDITFDKAVEWAKSVGGELPTRREQSLLFANLKEEFDDRWYWSCETHSGYSSNAWSQDFGNGAQYYTRRNSEFRAVAVRRLAI